MTLHTPTPIRGHHPLPSEVYIAESKIHGHGIFAQKTIPMNFDFGITHVADDRFPNGFIRTPFGGFINHSFTPNCQIYQLKDTMCIKTLREIKKGEELTIDYRPGYALEELALYR